MRVYKRSIQETLQNQKIVLSGEINMFIKTIGEPILRDDELFDTINSYTESMSCKYSFLEFEVEKGLHEISIKMFAYNQRFRNYNI